MEPSFINMSLICLGAVFFYAIVSRGLFKATDSARWEALDIFERFSADGRIANEQLASMRSSLLEMHSSLAAWRMVWLLVKVVLRLPFRAEISDDEAARRAQEGVPNCLKPEHMTFMRSWIVAVLGTSPVAALLFSIIGTFATAFSVSQATLFRSIAAPTDHHNGARPA